MTQERAPKIIAAPRPPSRVAYPKFFWAMKMTTRTTRQMISITKIIRTCE